MAQVAGDYQMPGLVPKPRHYPPKWSDHVLIHAVQVGVCFAWIAYMLLVLVGLFVGYGAMSSIYSPLNPAISVAMSLMVIIGAVAIVWALVSSTNRLYLVWKGHQTGISMEGGTWFFISLMYIVMSCCYW